MDWREYWNRDSPIYANGRHKTLHYGRIATDIIGHIPSPAAIVLDHGSGEALSAYRIATRCGRLYLLDAAPLVRERLEERFRDNPKIEVLAPDDLDRLGDGSLDLVVANSLLQYLSLGEFRSLLRAWRQTLKPGGRLVLADVIPPDVGPLADARTLLGFAWSGGFLLAATAGLARTALSDYRKLREEIGLSTYSEEEMIELLRDEGFSAERARRNIGHNQARMTFSARRL